MKRISDRKLDCYADRDKWRGGLTVHLLTDYLQAERQRVNELEALVRQVCEDCESCGTPFDAIKCREAECGFAAAREAVEG